MSSSSTEATRTDEATMTEEARTTDGPATGDMQDRGASSAAERLGGPSESEQPHDTTARRAETGADHQADTPAEPQATLIPADRAESYNSRWKELKGEFVDEPRGAVRGANELVGEVLDELEELFRRQRADLEEGLDSDQTTTEDLRLALGRYRSFFDRLLSF
jgi:hypothetical protein